ncbi:MAG: cell envelope integrity protein TolA [Nitrosomonadales bacterium]|nr:cell envelope integrity protein TolA [Nitrosomonadales bacterium]
MSATVYREPHRLPAGILALAVHGVFFALLYLGFSWNKSASLPATMSVELWQSLPEVTVAPPPARIEEVAPQPPQEKLLQEQVVKPDIAIPEKKQVVAKPAVIKPAKMKPAAKPVEVVKPEPVAPPPVEQKIAEPKPDPRIAAQQAAAMAERARQEEQAAAKGKVVDEYMGKIQAKIRRNIVEPPDVVKKDIHAVFRVTLLPGGGVLKAELKKSSGNALYDTAVERAILKSDPLPLPPDAALFNLFRELNLSFKPTE